MFDFAKITNDMPAIDVLNYYRNLYYAEPQVTERGIVANAINDVFDLINRQKAEIEGLNIEFKAMRGAANSYKAEVDRLQKRMSEQKHSLFEQQAYTAKLQNEIERLRAKVETRTQEKLALGRVYTQKLKTAKSEAYKEFAERLCEGKVLNDKTGIEAKALLKEMVGEENNRQGQHSYVSDQADEK